MIKTIFTENRTSLKFVTRPRLSKFRQGIRNNTRKLAIPRIMRKQQQFRGVYAILATPFNEDRSLDLESLRSLVEFEINAGVHGITILGILGEVLRLTDDERSIVTETVVRAADHRVPVISGTGGSGTDIAKRNTIQAQELGVDGVMIAPPRLVKPNDEAIFNYFAEIARYCELPIIVQDEPVTYGVNFSIELIAKLSQVEGIGYIKLEDPPTPIKISKIRSQVGNNFGIFGGMGGLYFYEELRRGACGGMTGFAYPEILCKIYESYHSGKHAEARDLFYKILPLIRYEAQPLVNLALRKEILKKRGAIKHSTMRPPATKIDSETVEELEELISTLNLVEVVPVNR